MAENEAASGINDSLYREYIKTHSCQILKCLICSITKWYSIKFVQIMVLWSKWHRPGGHRVYEAVIYLCLFLSVPWVCMQFVSVGFPGHTFFFTLTYI